MDVYGMFSKENQNFVNFFIDIFINLQKITSIFRVEIEYQTKFSDVFQTIKNSLIEYNMDMTECDDHHFVYINNQGEEEKLFHGDWNQFVKDLNIFSNDCEIKIAMNNMNLFHTMKLEQTHGCLDTNKYKLEKMIGIKKEFMVEVIPNEELSLFEESSRKLFLEASRDYSFKSLEEKLLVEHPIEMVTSKKTYIGSFHINVSLDQSEFRESKKLKNTVQIKNISINSGDTVLSVIQKAVSKFTDRGVNSLKIQDYLLRIAEREEYLVPCDIEIIKFQPINSSAQMGQFPNLMLISKKHLETSYNFAGRISKIAYLKSVNTINENAFKHGSLEEPDYIFIHDLWKLFKKSSGTDSYNDNSSLSSNEKNTDDALVSILDNMEHTDLLYVVKISKIELPKSSTLPKDQKIVIIACLYHGEKSLCEHQYREWSTDSPGCEILFPIEIWNLPRMARLSFALAVVKNSMSIKDFPNSSQKKYIGWGNVMVYDHKSILKFETIQYRLWTTGRLHFNPTGSVYSNPDGGLVSPLLTIQMVPKLTNFKKIVYPPIEILITEAGKMLENDVDNSPNDEEDLKIQEILSRSSIDDVMEDEQNILWKFRYTIRDKYQDSLPRILNSRPWNNFENVAKMQHLVCGWPIDKDIIISLGVLGPDFPDCDIRVMAVDSISRIGWQEVSLYLLQICQCLKYESYINSNLIQWLLKIMVSNAKIAQSIFYLMKVEISSCEWCKVPFSIILYSYLQYSPSRCSSLLRQHHATNEICQHNKGLMQVSNLDGERKAQALERFRSALLPASSKEIFNNLTCPVDCNIILKTLNPKECKFMDSKMRPIKLNWHVNIEFKKEYQLIYKNGDDLRQDALIVQMLHIMDSIWQRNNLDLKLCPYNVLACSKTEGYIQVVQNAETLANIYKVFKTKNSSPFYDWLKSLNTGDQMKTVVNNFKSSCAAYCVATFILGIGDRHSDNIMITKDGHFFHIDFGHILGNFKKMMKGMVTREWTKFILVQDFLYIIAERQLAKEHKFKELCCTGYLALRKYSNLILSLFKIMVNAGIPELSCMDDLNYIKETLQIGKTEEDAKAYFLNIYDDTLKKEMFVTLNWNAHNIRRNNI